MKFFHLLLIALCSFSASCTKEEIKQEDIDSIPDLGGDTWAKGPIDEWIKSNYTDPYNISVVYRWDQFEADPSKLLVPPKEDYVVPVLNAINNVWAKVYIGQAGDIFFRKYAPKFFTLVGSPAFNNNGSITLGQAEGGRKVLLYNLNNTRVKGMSGYRQSDSSTIKEMLHTIHHEFGHILHQNVMYPEEFKSINSNLFTTDWINYTDAAARRDGFVTAYCMNVADDDFVETLSVMLVEGRIGFEKMLADIPEGTTPRGTTREKAIERLRKKEATVVNYMKQVWNIDFYALQEKTRAALEAEIY